MPRQAILLVADEIFYNLHGKAILHGIYHSDLTMHEPSVVVPQLIFFFIGESDITDPFRSVTVEVTLPGNEPVRQQVPVMWPPQMSDQRTKLFVR
jgi:hypothetical protein